MAINITFQDFDTVCFSNQHNIIQLINNAVGISIEINLTQGQIANLQSQLNDVSDKAQEGHDALLLTTNLNQRLGSVERRVTAIEDLDATTHNTELYKEFEEIARQLRDLDKRVTDLE